MKITAISDTHGKHSELKLPGGGILIHAGDVGESKSDTRNFLHWLDSQDYDFKVFIAGNHDRYIEDRFDDFMSYVNHYKSLVYLQDDFVIINGIKIYGAPWSRNLPRWAFQLLDEHAEAKWNQIPADTDILVTHGPAYGHGDLLMYPRMGEDPKCGCKALGSRIWELSIGWHIFGHIHEDYGVTDDVFTQFINASSVDINYQVVNEPINFEI